MKENEFGILLSTCSEVAQWFPEGVVFIGGIAIYLHAVNTEATQALAATANDADFYISLADMGDLRDIEELTPNRLRSKHQMIKSGFEFDIYTERQSQLIVPYDAIAAHSVVYDGVRVSSLEHLLVLKLEAFADRKGSAKGDKDAGDLLRIAAVSKALAATGHPLDPLLVLPYLRDVHWDLLRSVEKSHQVTALAHGNAVIAKQIRQGFSALVDKLSAADAGSDLAATHPSPRG